MYPCYGKQQSALYRTESGHNSRTAEGFAGTRSTNCVEIKKSVGRTEVFVALETFDFASFVFVTEIGGI
jgi:hypothetical protein